MSIVAQQTATKGSSIAMVQQSTASQVQRFGRQISKSSHFRGAPRPKDNPAETKWRKRLPADGSFDLPRSYLELAAELGLTEQTTKAPNLFGANPFKFLTDIGRRTGTFIRSPGARDQRIDIWAVHSADLLRAQRELSLFFRPFVRKSVPHTKFRSRDMPPVHTISDQAQRKWNKLIEAHAKVELYRQEPEKTNSFAFTGIFLWPINEVQPDMAFGSSHSALDYLRQHNSCFITFDRQLSVFKVLTNDEDGQHKVQKVITRLRIAFCECAALSSIPLEIYLVQPSTTGFGKTTVKMIDVDLRYGLGSASATPSPPSLLKTAQLVESGFEGAERLNLDDEDMNLIARNEVIMKTAIIGCLSRMIYRRGRIQMRTHIGAFVFSKYYLPKDSTSISTTEFIQNMSGSSTKGNLQQLFLINDNAQDLFRRIHEADDLLLPIDSFSESLKDVKPMHTASFQFAYGRSEYVKLHVETSPTSLEQGTYETSQKQWTIHSRVDMAPLQLYMVPLKKGIAWKMHITANRDFDSTKVTSHLKTFANSVHLIPPTRDTEIADGSTELMFEFSRDGNESNDHFFRQKTAWHYRIRGNGSYIFEIVRYDKFNLGSNPRRREPCEPAQWGFSLWCDTWDEKFGENASLKLGEHATWRPSLDVFFPRISSSTSSCQHAGFGDYLKIMQAIVDRLDESIGTKA